jgi:Tfp pilus assembly protein PilN
MLTIDLLKGQGIPARSRPEGIIATAVTVVAPVAIAITMLGVYLSNRVVINIQRREISGYEQKISELSDAMRIHKSYQQRRGTIQQRISETAGAIEAHEQWSEILVTIVKNMPESLVLRRMAVEQRTSKVRVADSEDPQKKVDKMVPARTLHLTLGGAAGEVSDREVQAFRDRLRVSSVLGPKLEDVPVSQQVEMVDGQEVITYEMRCILKPQI